MDQVEQFVEPHTFPAPLPIDRKDAARRPPRCYGLRIAYIPSMKQSIGGFLFVFLSVIVLSGCAATQDEPEVPEAQQMDSTIREQMALELETVAPPTPPKHDDPEREYFALTSDTVRVTQDGSTVWVMVRGPLGNGCMRHEQYDSVAQGTTLYLTMWGSRPTDPNVVCTEQMQSYDREIRIENSPYTRYSLVQPDGRAKSYTLAARQISAR